MDRMPKQTPSEQLDQVVERLLAGPDRSVSRPDASRPFDPGLAPVMEVVSALCDLPRGDFKARLRADLERRAAMASSAKAASQVPPAAVSYLAVRNASAAIEFYKKAFGATETVRLTDPDGKIAHAEIRIGSSSIYLADEMPAWQNPSPETLGGSAVTIVLNVADVDAVVRQAVEAGAKVVDPVADQFYGERRGKLLDPFGHVWRVSTRIEDISNEEMRRRFDALMRQAAETTKPVVPIREGFHSVTPYLIVSPAGQLVDFMKEAFGAQEGFRVNRPGEQTIMHSEVKIGDSMIELSDGSAEFPPAPVTMLLRVSDVDAVYKRALEAGAAPFQPVADHDYGSRGGSVKDLAHLHAVGRRQHLQRLSQRDTTPEPASGDADDRVFREGFRGRGGLPRPVTRWCRSSCAGADRRFPDWNERRARTLPADGFHATPLCSRCGCCLRTRA